MFETTLNISVPVFTSGYLSNDDYMFCAVTQDIFRAAFCGKKSVIMALEPKNKHTVDYKQGLGIMKHTLA